MQTKSRLDYKPLWKLLIDRDMTKTDLQKATGLSAATIAKLGRGGNVTTAVLLQICDVFSCELSDIAKVVSADSAKGASF